MNRCTAWAICPLGDTAKAIGCRKPGCPINTMADIVSPFIGDAERTRAYALAEKNGRDNMDVSRPRKIKLIENIRNWWKYRNAPLTISIDDEGLVILGGVVNQRVIADCDVGIGKDLLMRKQLDVRNLVNAGGGTWTTESPYITTSGCFENEL